MISSIYSSLKRSCDPLRGRRMTVDKTTFTIPLIPGFETPTDRRMTVTNSETPMSTVKSRRQMLDDAVFGVARAHDIRRSHPIFETQRIRATARMEQIMATNPTANPTRAGSRAARGFETRSSRSSLPWSSRNWTGQFRGVGTDGRFRLSAGQLALRLTAIPVAAAAIIAGTTLSQPGTPTGPQPAFASWTRIPTAVSADLIDPASTACLHWLNLRGLSFSSPGGVVTPPPGRGLTTPLEGLPLVSEQRGDWILLGFASPEAPLAHCLLQVIDGQPTVVTTTMWGDGWMSGGLVDGSRMDVLGSMTGVSGGWSEAAPTGAAGLEIRHLADEGTFMGFSAQVDPDVVGLTITLNSGETIEASVAGGIALAWWPVASDATVFGSPVSSYTFTLADGSVLNLDSGDVLPSDRPDFLENPVEDEYSDAAYSSGDEATVTTGAASLGFEVIGSRTANFVDSSTGAVSERLVITARPTSGN